MILLYQSYGHALARPAISIGAGPSECACNWTPSPEYLISGGTLRTKFGRHSDFTDCPAVWESRFVAG
ncbi:hypothetical protein SAMN05443144_1354 [Fodinibius roseus]|uniref:Uncharacterized protein n=1 Tax=Fodinibius roseus TaxID=1194090 RepID=A0A1M5KVQ4_9BACT|nr:hypothetical protein SAMN05443144_1354 [Fodinibius roseus]